MNAGDFAGNPIIAAQMLAKKQTEEAERVKEKAQISKTQKPTIPAPPPPSVDPESFANKGDGVTDEFRDANFGLGTYGKGRPGDSNVNNGAPNISLSGALNWVKGVIGLDG